MHDSIVVGAGPAGSLAAREMAERKQDVLVLEEHPTPGLPQHCTGLITDEVIRLSRVKPDIISTIHGARVFFPNGKSILISSRKPIARVVDRVDLEIRMAQAAIDAGAKYAFEERYDSHIINDSVVVKTNKGAHKARLLVGADGQASSIAMSLGDNEPVEYVRGLQADVSRRMPEQGIMNMYVGNCYAPGFFAWEIPCGKFTRVGLCTEWSAGPPTNYLTDLLIKLGYQNNVVNIYAGKIPLGGRQFTYGDRILLAGDAGGFVKPISGGGLYPAFKANKHLVDVACDCLDSDTLYARDLSEYERGWKEEIGKDLEQGYKFRKRFKRMADPDFDKAYEYCNKPEVLDALSEMDIDHPMRVISNLPKRSVLKGIPLFLRSFI